MATLDIDVIKNIPGYKVILKTVLKSQIQQLVEQLASTTDEESMILTASLSDGSLCLLGSTYGNRFIKDHEDIKSQFLSFCQKKHYGEEQQENEQHDTLQAHTQASSVQRSVRSPRSDSLQASPGRNKRCLDVRYEPYPMTRSRSKRSAIIYDPVCEPEQSHVVIKLDEDIINNINNEVSYLSKYDKPSTVTNVINEANSENIVDDDTAPQPTETSINSEIDNDVTYPCLSVKLEAIAETLKSFAEHDSELECKNVEPMGTIHETEPETVGVEPRRSETEPEITGVELPRVMPPISKGPNVLLDVKFEPSSDDTDSQRDMNEKENNIAHVTHSEQSFQSGIAVPTHARIHTGTNEMICSKCGKAFDDSNESTVSSGNNTTVETVQCETCFSANSVDGQLKSAKKRKKNQHKCRKCGKCFLYKSLLKQHQVKYTGIKPFKCDKCEKTFSHKKSLNAHQVIHTGIKLFKCEICGKSCAHKSNLTTHLASHSGDRPFNCDICGKSFKYKQTMKEHKIIHSGIKPFKCDKCEKTFSHKKSLNTHRAIHTGINLFKCDICGKLFTHKGNLTSHLARHSGVKSFNCNLCGKSFTQKGTLSTHLASHMGVKPFKCDICGKSFTRKYILTKHLARHSV